MASRGGGGPRDRAATPGCQHGSEVHRARAGARPAAAAPPPPKVARGGQERDRFVGGSGHGGCHAAVNGVDCQCRFCNGTVECRAALTDDVAEACSTMLTGPDATAQGFFFVQARNEASQPDAIPVRHCQWL